MASTLPGGETFEPEKPGSRDYRSRHMSLIFSQGLSFSGFERDKVFLSKGKTEGGIAYFDLSDVSGADSENDGRAACVADFDDDGDPDLFVTNIQRSRHLLYRNDLGSESGNRFLKLRLRATKGHHEAIGAIVKVRTPSGVQAQVKSAGSGFVSQHSAELIFGLGAASEGEVEVRWPGGSLERFGTVRAGRYVLVEGTGEARPRPARTFPFADPPPRGFKLRLGDPVPSLKLEDGARKRVEVRPGGRPLLINFWASYCASCLKEMPELEKLHRRGDYRVVAINLDPPSERERARKILERFATTFPSYYAPPGVLERYLDLDTLALPANLWIGPDGKLERVSGALPPSE